jgi:hypothetical protein
MKLHADKFIDSYGKNKEIVNLEFDKGVVPITVKRKTPILRDNDTKKKESKSTEEKSKLK